MRGVAARNTGVRAFWTLIALSMVLRTATAYFACCVALALVRRVDSHGFVALQSTSTWAGTALLVVSAVGSFRAGRRLGHGVRATYAISREVHRRRGTSDPSLLDIPRARTVASTAPFAFTYGLLFPRIAVSTGLTELLSAQELEAVIAHEMEHARKHDPLKSLLTEVLTTRYVGMPLLGHLRSAFTAQRELTADRHATARCGRRAVAGALLKTADTPHWVRGAPAAAMGAADLLGARIAQLEAGRPARLSTPTLRTATLIALGAAGYAWMIYGSTLLLATTPPGCMAPFSWLLR